MVSTNLVERTARLAAESLRTGVPTIDLVADGFKPVKSADRTLEILERLADAGDRLSLGELSAELGIPKSSLHAILRTMQHRRWVETDPTGHRFGLGVRAVEIGASYVDTDDNVIRMEPILDALSEELGETVHLGRLDGNEIVYLSKRESRHHIRLYSAIGRRLPAHATALGKAILATLEPDVRDRLLRTPLPALTAHTITDLDELRDELANVRMHAFAVDREENTEGIRCFAVPVPSGRSAPDAISVSVPIFRLDEVREQQVIETLLAAAERARATSRRYR
jgi:DNA-binding IclR family transcriptional regulator